MTLPLTMPPPPREKGPAWDIARLFPNQGHWTEGDYLLVSRRTNRLVELDEGKVKVLPMPTLAHQDIVLYLCDALRAFVKPRDLGRMTMAPYPVRLWPGQFREPDVGFLLAEHTARMSNDFADGADLVMEVVSDDRRHDLEIKRAEYAKAGIAEYWIIDPRERRVTVLTLTGKGARKTAANSKGRPKGSARAYAVHGEHAPGDRAASALLKGFEVDVAAVFAAAGKSG